MRFSIIPAALLMALPCLASRGAGDTPRPWTFLLYGAADNNCDGPILEYIELVRNAIDDDAGIELLAFVDRHEKFSEDAKVLGEDFTGARLYRIRKGSSERLAGGEQFPEITTSDDAELDSAAGDTLQRFIAWGKATAPAKRYGLIIYSHANGESMCPDEQSGRRMGFAELSDSATDEDAVDFLALELCAMGGIEISYQWRPGTAHFGTDVMLAVPNSGPPLDWDRIFARVRSPGHASAAKAPWLDPSTMSAADFGKLAIEEARRGRKLAGEDARHESAGCYDMAQAKAVKQAVDALAVALATSDSKKAFLGLRTEDPASAMRYGETFFVDLYDLCSLAAKTDALGEKVRRACENVKSAVDRFVLASYGMSDYARFEPGKNGVFIVLPPVSAPGEEPWPGLSMYTPLAGSGGPYGKWAFLADGATPGNGVVENWFELIDSWFDRADDKGGVNGYRW